MKQLRHRIYRLQQRLAVTRREAAAILGLSGLLFVGVLVLWIPQRPPPPPDERAARAFAAGSAALEGAPGDTAAASSGTDALRAGVVNINTAGPAVLERLPGIGPVLAERILAYRRAHGRFASEDELIRVSGIGPKTMERLAPLIITVPPDTMQADSVGGR